MGDPSATDSEKCEAARFLLDFDENEQDQEVFRQTIQFSFESVELATLEWVDWFNNRRLLEPIGNIPPAEAEERYYAMLDEQKLAV